MRVFVYMRDGRTVHALERRGDLIQLVQRKPAELDRHKPIRAETRFHVDDVFVPSQLMFLSASSISYVEASIGPLPSPAAKARAAMEQSAARAEPRRVSA